MARPPRLARMAGGECGFGVGIGHGAWGNTAGSWQKTDILYKELLLHAASCLLSAASWLLDIAVGGF